MDSLTVFFFHSPKVKQRHLDWWLLMIGLWDSSASSVGFPALQGYYRIVLLSSMEGFIFSVFLSFCFFNLLNFLSLCFLYPQVSVQIEVLLKVFMEHLSQILCNAFHTILMRVYHCRFTERVSIQLCRCMDNAFRMLQKVVVCRNAVLVIIDGIKQVVVSLQRLLLGIFCRMMRSLPTSVLAFP